MKIKKLVLVLALSSVLTLTACNSEPSKPDSGNNGGGVVDVVKLEGLKITADGNATKLTVGKSLQLTAIPTPATASVDVDWLSTNEEVATVSKDGVVSALKPGLTVIKATSKSDSKIKAEYSLTVEKAPIPNPTSIALTTKDNILEVEIGKTLKINAEVIPSEADQGVEFSSSDEAIATVNNSGLITALKEGKVTITATSTKLNTITKAIEITVKASSHEADGKWTQLEFSNHEAYLSAAKKTLLKVKGTVTHKVESNDKMSVSYFLQSGKEGFYIKGQKLTVGNVEVGKTYAVGGLKQWSSGCNSISDIEYLEELSDVIAYEDIDISEATNLSYDAQKSNMGSKIKLNSAIITDLPSDFSSSKGFSVGIKNGAAAINLRIAPAETANENFVALGDLFKTLSVGQEISLTGIMSSFGYGKPASQIILLKASDVIAKELDDAAKVKLAASDIAIPFTLDNSVEVITLPQSNSKFSEVKLEWTSSDTNISIEDGKVTHDNRDKVVTLTLTASLNGKTFNRDFLVNVLSANDDYLSLVGKLDFEDASTEQKYGCSATKSGYKSGTINLGGHNWELNNALIGGAEDDRRNGIYSTRLQTSGDDNSIVLLDALEFDTLEFIAATYGTNKLGAIIEVSYAVGDATEFTKLDLAYELSDLEIHKIRVKLPVAKGSKVRIKISALKGHGQRLNIDDIKLLLES